MVTCGDKEGDIVGVRYPHDSGYPLATRGSFSRKSLRAGNLPAVGRQHSTYEYWVTILLAYFLQDNGICNPLCCVYTVWEHLPSFR